METPTTSDTSHLLPVGGFGVEEGPSAGEILVRDDSNSFRPLRSIFLAIIQIILNGVLFLESVLYLHFVDHCKNHTVPIDNEAPKTTFWSVLQGDCGSIVIYSFSLLWMLTWLINFFVKFLHRRHRNYGYLKFYTETSYMADIPLFSMCIGGFFLVIAMTMKSDDFVFTGKYLFGERRIWFFLQVLMGAEFVVVTISLLVYIVKVSKFNSSQPVPDVFNMTNISSLPLIFNARSAVEIGPGITEPNKDIALLQSVCEHQGDVIRYLKRRSDILCAKLSEINTTPRRM